MKQTYIKSDIQITLEDHIYLIKEKGANSLSSLRKAEPSLYSDFMIALSDEILSLLQEKQLHNLIKSINRTYYPNMHESDYCYDIAAEAILGLFKTIKRTGTPNYGRVRVDVFLDEPQVFVQKLRFYIKHNILLDMARRYQAYSKHIGQAITIVDGHKINKIDFVGDDFDLENTVVSKLTCTYNPSLRQEILTGIIERFRKRKPVALLLYNMLLLNIYNTQTAVTILTECTNADFNNLLHTLIHALSVQYGTNLNMYDNVEFTADTYLESFRALSDIKARRNRVDRLLSDTRKVVQKLDVCNKHKKNRGISFSKSGKTYRLHS